MRSPMRYGVLGALFPYLHVLTRTYTFAEGADHLGFDEQIQRHPSES
jgi:hypothetical protein